MSQEDTSALLTVKQFCEKYPWPSESAIRAIILEADARGFATAFKRYGRRILVDPKEFFLSLERLQNKKVSASTTCR